MVAVDAGVHLAAINRILEKTLPENIADLPLPYTIETGPFAGLEVNSPVASASAAHVARSLVDTYLITHPHLDHIAGFVINTAGLPGRPRAKRLAGLPSTVEAFKNHIFNNVIWPNLSDENGGAGLVTYLRLVDGGSPAMGDGEGRGYIEVADSLCVKACSVSHGEPVQTGGPRGSHSSASTPARFSSFDASSMTPSHSQQHLHQHLPRNSHISLPRSVQQYPASFLNAGHRTPSYPAMPQTQSAQQSPSLHATEPPHPHVYDSTAYFIRDYATGSEVLIFGDVEPDSLSPYPRNIGIWQEAAPKIARGDLRAIVLECSYDDSHPDDRMFGHLKPQFIAEEMRTLAGEVKYFRDVGLAGVETQEGEHGPRSASRDKKRKRNNSGLPGLQELTRRRTGGSSGTEPVSPKTMRSRLNSGTDDNSGVDLPDMDTDAGASVPTPHLATPTAEMSLRDLEVGDLDPAYSDAVQAPAVNGGEWNPDGPQQLPLEGVKVVIFHVKDTLDGSDQGAKILAELEEHESKERTGAEFIISYPGQGIYV